MSASYNEPAETIAGPAKISETAKRSAPELIVGPVKIGRVPKL